MENKDIEVVDFSLEDEEVNSSDVDSVSTFDVPDFKGFDTGIEDEKIVNTSNLDYSAFDIKEDDFSFVAPTSESFEEVTSFKPEEVVTTKEEQKIMMDALASAPTNINDDLLKLEDTLTRNNLKEEIEKASAEAEEEATGKSAVIFIAGIFILLAALILSLPFIIKIM